MKKVAIIIPVYGVEKYIKKCIESVKNQEYDNISVFIVNDETKDKSVDIAKEVIGDDKRFVILNKKNGGVSSARNFALDYIFKNNIEDIDYIFFLDSDDYIERNCISELLKRAKENSLKMVVGSVKSVYLDENLNEIEKEDYKEIIGNKNFEIYDYNQVLKILYRSKLNEGAVFSMSTCKLIKKEIFDNLRFGDIKLNEDEDIIYKLYIKAEKIGFLDMPLLNYVIRQKSMMRSQFNIARFDIIKILDKRIEIFKEYNIDTYNTKYAYLNKLYRLIKDAKKYIKEQNNKLEKEEKDEILVNIVKAKEKFVNIYKELYCNFKNKFSKDSGYKFKHRIKMLVYFLLIKF